MSRPPLSMLRRRLAASSGAPKPVKNKYGAKQQACAQGHVHDSGREAKRCTELHLLLRGGVIADLRQQVSFYFEIGGKVLKHPNGRRVGVTFDYVYREGEQAVAEDSKGFRVRDWPLRRAIFEALFPEYEVRES